MSHISPPVISSLSVIHKFDYVFAENGTVQYKDGKLVSKQVSKHPLTLTMLAHMQCHISSSGLYLPISSVELMIS